MKRLRCCRIRIRLRLVWVRSPVVLTEQRLTRRHARWKRLSSQYQEIRQSDEILQILLDRHQDKCGLRGDKDSHVVDREASTEGNLVKGRVLERVIYVDTA